MTVFGRKRRRIAQSRKRAAETDEHMTRLQDQRSEVTALSLWARFTYEQNHLTELFLASRK